MNPLKQLIHRYLKIQFQLYHSLHYYDPKTPRCSNFSHNYRLYKSYQKNMSESYQNYTKSQFILSILNVFEQFFHIIFPLYSIILQQCNHYQKIVFWFSNYKPGNRLYQNDLVMYIHIPNHLNSKFLCSYPKNMKLHAYQIASLLPIHPTNDLLKYLSNFLSLYPTFLKNNPRCMIKISNNRLNIYVLLYRCDPDILYSPQVIQILD